MLRVFKVLRVLKVLVVLKVLKVLKVLNVLRVLKVLMSKCLKCSIKVRLPYRVLFYLKLPIFILQWAYIPKKWGRISPAD